MRNQDKELQRKYTPIHTNTVLTSPLLLALLFLSISAPCLSVSLQFKDCQILPKPIRVYVRSSGGACGDIAGYRVARGLKRLSQSAIFNNIRKEQQQQAINQPLNSEQTLTCWIWDSGSVSSTYTTHIQNQKKRMCQQMYTSMQACTIIDAIR